MTGARDVRYSLGTIRWVLSTLHARAKIGSIALNRRKYYGSHEAIRLARSRVQSSRDLSRTEELAPAESVFDASSSKNEIRETVKQWWWVNSMTDGLGKKTAGWRVLDALMRGPGRWISSAVLDNLCGKQTASAIIARLISKYRLPIEKRAGAGG